MFKALILVVALTGAEDTQNRTMVFASKAGVCGDGRSYISMGRDDEGRETFFTQHSRGFNTTTDSRDYQRRDCDPGPVRVEVTIENGAVTDIDTYVGGPATINTSARAAVDYLLDIAESSTRGTVAKHA
jgi:hypothetical protein